MLLSGSLCPLPRTSLSLALALTSLSVLAASESAELPATRIDARSEQPSYQDKPYSVSTIDSEELRERRQQDLEDALRGTPGVSVYSSGGPNDYNLMIRGVGSLYQMSMDDSSVGMSLDGIDMSSRNLSFGTLDVERVEVLKGPQGTRSAASGAAGSVNVVTRKPTWETEGYLRAEIGQQGQHFEEGAIGGALGEQLSARIAVRNSGEDSWLDNSNDGDPASKPRQLAWRGSLLWQAAETTSALLTAERHQVERKYNMLVLRPYGNSPYYDVEPGLFDDNQKTMERYSLQIDQDIGALRLTSTTAMTRMDFSGLIAYDARLYEALYGAPSVFWNVDEADEETFSQDFRLSAAPDATLDWAAGLALSRNERSYDTPSNTYGKSSAKYRDFTTNRYALYGETSVPVADALTLTAGLRHTWDRKTYHGEYHGGGEVVTDSRRLTDNYSTGRLGLTYELSAQSNLYALLSRGYKSGGFNDYAAQPADSEPYRAATLDSIEVGFKSQSANGQYELNGALYYTRTRDDHILSYDPTTFATTAFNADTRSKGAELEGLWRPGYGLTFNAGLSYIDARITSEAIGLGTGEVHSGNRVPDTSRWNGSLGVAYRQPVVLSGLPAAAINARINYQYVGARAADPQNNFDLAHYEDLTLHLGLEIGGSEVYAWADNLLDEQYDLYGFYSNDVTYGAPSRGRSLGVGYRYSF